MKSCEICDDEGWLRNSITRAIERCDACKRFADDDEAAEHVARVSSVHSELVKALELCLFGVTADADANDGQVDRAALAGVCRDALAKAKGETNA